MNNLPEISVIVPVYKVEEYLPQCIDSILAQTFTDFELLLVDDGSPDRCGEICEEYAGKDMRIRVFHQQNSGVSAARNIGLQHAKGTYIVLWIQMIGFPRIICCIYIRACPIRVLVW